MTHELRVKVPIKIQIQHNKEDFKRFLNKQTKRIISGYTAIFGFAFPFSHLFFA